MEVAVPGVLAVDTGVPVIAGVGDPAVGVGVTAMASVNVGLSVAVGNAGVSSGVPGEVAVGNGWVGATVATSVGGGGGTGVNTASASVGDAVEATGGGVKVVADCGDGGIDGDGATTKTVGLAAGAGAVGCPTTVGV